MAGGRDRPDRRGGKPPSAASAESIARGLDPKAKRTGETGKSWSCRCPAHEDAKASLSLTDAGDGKVLWRCHAGCSQNAVADALRARGLIGQKVANGAGRGKRLEWTPLAKPPPGAPQPDFAHRRLGKPSMTWCYRDADGAPLFHVARFETTDGKEDGKEYLPFSWCRSSASTEAWRWKAPPAPRALYKLDQIVARPDATVLVTEGEKKSDAAEALFPDLVATNSQGGAKAPGRSDWAPLAGRNVTIWPDHDAPGRAYADRVAELATAAGAESIRIVAVPPSFPPKWDLADPTPDGADTAALLAAAPLWTRPAGPDPADAPNVQGSFKVGRAGVFRLVEDSEGNREWVWTASEIEVLAETRNAAGEAWGRLLRVPDRDAIEHRWAMPMGMLAGDGVVYRERLLSLGAELAPGKAARDALHTYLTIWRPAARARCVESTGWHGQVFVLPDRVYGATAEPVFLQAPGAAPQYDLTGSLEGWQNEVAALAVDNTRLVFAISTALAAALLYPAQEESGGVHYFGPSSTGKTTIGVAAASVWGIPKRSWRTTANAAEALARGSCDALLFMDEISQAEPWEIDAMAYMLGNDSGKARMRRDATARETITWRTLFLSTGEIGLLAKLIEIGRRPRAGQSMRLLEIPADAGAGRGCFEKLHGRHSGDALARQLKLAADRHRGHAARAFVEQVAGDFDGVGEAVADYRRRWLGAIVPEDADGQALRAAGRVALIGAAGELAIGWEILPWPAGEAEQAATACFTAWLATHGGAEPQEVIEGLAQIRKFIEEHGNDRFELAWDIRHDQHGEEIPERVVNRAGFRRHDPTADAFEFFVLPEAWRREVCKGFDHVALARAMLAKGWLKPGEGKNLAQRTAIPRHGKIRVYHILPDFLEGEP
jgi:uncharacterized protein (DUF927 family)